MHITLLRLALLLVTLTALGIGIPNYLNTRVAISRLSQQVMNQASQQTVDKTTEYLNEAQPALELCREMLLHDSKYVALSAGADTAERAQDRSRLFLHVLEAHPPLTRIYFGSRDGDFTSAYRAPDNHLELDHRWISGAIPHRTVWKVGPGEDATPVESKASLFDPRKRPWYQSAVRQNQTVWTEPYLFAASQQPGITVAAPVQNGHGEILGVLGVDYELRGVNDFVRGLHPGNTGSVFLFAGQPGQERVIAQPGNQITSSRASGDLLPAVQDAGPVTRAAGQWLDRRGRPAGPRSALAAMEFEAAGKRYLGAARPFDVGNLHWTALVAIPEDDVLAVVKQNNLLTLGWSLCAILVAVFLGNLLAAQISRPLDLFAREMQRVGNLEFSDAPLPPSPIYEIHIMSEALERMKIGLRAFEKYVPTDLVRTILTSERNPSLGGECAELSVLFADVVNFTGASEHLSPDELVDALADYLELMEEIVWEHGGIVDKYIGDAVMALWDTPIRPEDEATRRACVAALHCVQRLKALRSVREASGKPFFDLNIGIHTGEALVGNIGSLRRLNYTAMGDTVNVASRLEALNRIYGTHILVSDATFGEVKDVFEARLIDRVAVKGRSQAISIYEILAERGKLDARLEPVLTAYAEGLRLYHERKWEPAQTKFMEAAHAGPQPDPPALLFAARCESYRETPPPPDWNGVFVLTRK